MKQLVTLFLIFCLPSTAFAATAVRVDYGEVVGMQHVMLKSQAAKGATLGGIAGLAASHGKDRHDTAKRAAVGAALGLLLAKAAQGKRDGIHYSIALRDGSSIEYTTEPRDIEVGDCVSVEEGRHVNIRRVSDAMCEHPHEVTAAYHENDLHEANECQEAKHSLLQAETEQQANAAAIKVQVLCHH